ncbi:metallophosphoesterase [Hyella patelloides]|nr:metallophosphoesterase [Hyella patelloides]
MPSLLTDPFLQLPTANSVNVVWFTEFPGENHWVLYGQKLENKVTANTTQLTRVREDSESKLEPKYEQLTQRDIWRHEATVTGLNYPQRISYQVVSLQEGETVSSQQFTLTGKPQPGTPLKILLTSDHQLMPMTAANLQKVAETIDRVDAVFLAGDLVNIPDRASEWFDDSRGGAFFPSLQGKAHYQLEKDGVTTTYKGGEIIQYAPLFPAIGNHEVMGRYSTEKPLGRQYNDAVPRNKSLIENTSDLTTIKNNSYNSDTYEEIFSLPGSESEEKPYYAVTFGDIRLVSLYITNIWRTPELNRRNLPARYAESPTDFNHPERWGYGQHIFEPIAKGRKQYQWLESELQSDEFQQAKYKIVMFHHPPHTLGGNIVPPYTSPQQTIQRDSNNEIQAITYEYPKENDYIIRDLIPLLETAEVQFVYYGHSHLWNRFQSDSGMHFLESSNVGNSYGAHTSDNPRTVPPNSPDNVAVGNPNGLEPIMPNIDPLQDETGQPLSYIASNDITVFSVLDTEQGIVSSYRFDTRQPDSEVIKFDEFRLGR